MKGLLLPAFFYPFFLFAQTESGILNALLKDSALEGAHAGISVYDPEADSFLIRYQSDKLFLPASNTKLFTLYAALKYLGDSIPGLLVADQNDRTEIAGTGDPSFLHPRFSSRIVFDFLKNSQKDIVLLMPREESFRPFGDGWSMDDYDAGYAPERSRLPIYGNVASFYGTRKVPQFFPQRQIDASFSLNARSYVRRNLHRNRFEVFVKTEDEKINLCAPMILSNKLLAGFLYDTLHKRIITEAKDSTYFKNTRFKILYSGPTDSLLRMMMHESDNFLAEQALLMASLTTIGKMSDSAMISFLLSGPLKDLPQKPRWADASGLSRYNLFSTNDLVFILRKLMLEFSFERVSSLLPSGGRGTLSNHFLAEKPFIYAKTGSMSNTSCLSGYLLTNSGKKLIFSLMINNLSSNQEAWKKARETFINNLRKAY